jgi:copper chaperone CopZ
MLWVSPAVEKSHTARCSPRTRKLRFHGNWAAARALQLWVVKTRNVDRSIGAVRCSCKENPMNRISTRAFRWLAPLAGITLLSGIASAKVITEVWQVKGVHTPADETKIHEALTKLPTVTGAIVHMSTVRVTFDDEKLQDARLKDAVAKAGSFELMSKLPEHPKKAAPEHAKAPKS